MNTLSILIMNFCLMKPDIKCVEQMHVCVRDVFEINFWDELTPDEESKLPLMIQYCDIERQLSYE
jgi:hypothetical protein